MLGRRFKDQEELAAGEGTEWLAVQAGFSVMNSHLANTYCTVTCSGTGSGASPALGEFNLTLLCRE